MTIGNRIRKLRRSSNLTQEELGLLLGVQKATIQKYENGSIVNLKTEHVEQLAKIFNVSPSYIIGWDEFDKKYDLVKLRNEVQFIEKIQKLYGNKMVDFYETLSQLNREGFNRVYTYTLDIKENPKFRK